MNKFLSKKTSVLFGISFLLVAIVLLLCFYMHGEKKITTTAIENEQVNSLTCNANIAYPFFKKDSSTYSNLKIVVVFDNEILSSITLTNKLEYKDEEDAQASEAINHIAVNIHLNNNGLTSDSFHAHYSILPQAMVMNIYAKLNELNSVSNQYFLLDNSVEENGYAKNAVETNYLNKQFSCVYNN